MNTGAAEATRYSEGSDRRKLWTARWESSNLTFASDGSFGGSMLRVTGTLYDQDRPVSNFKAQSGSADQESGELELRGAVEIVSLEHGATLRSDRIVWASKGSKVVRALGGVQLESDRYRTGEFPELWATPDLSQVGTPDSFKQE